MKTFLFPLWAKNDFFRKFLEESPFINGFFPLLDLMPFSGVKTEIRLIKVSKIIHKSLKFSTTKITEQCPFFKLIAVFCFYAEFYLFSNK